ncbi:hypothetical protein PIB30_086948 [Stylosanthes scabra]|uniref:Leucine-rich repeat-containing N-terminal plant-type domain-containing protein n=1 Tax=Stylosanthes scabra TaxID=79078 RepID=A0ABU6VWX0_9FABA|nr:hypothetical protein [Stylosanthes scabra]
MGFPSYLLKLREALHNVPSDWFDNKTGMCDWTGVHCTTPDITNSRNVQGIDLNNKNLTGTIPSGLNDSFFQLTLLNLDGNFLSGPLPSLPTLSPLRDVDLSFNNFNSIPHGFFQGLDRLEFLDLSNNTNLPPWTFPTNLNTSQRLTNLDLSATNLVGPLPDIFDSFPILGLLFLPENNLTGVLPKSFATLRRLQHLDLSDQKGNTKLSGTIQFLSSLPELFDVDLEGNSFEGSILDLPNRTHSLALLLANNRLTGVVPPSLFLGNQGIDRATLDNNSLQGPLPIFNESFTEVIFGGNGFCLNHSGPCDHRVTTLLQVAEAFGYPFRLAQSWRGNNPYQGWNFITCHNNGNIRTVNFTNLNFMGTISPAFQNLTDLYELYLGRNKLSGSIPESLTILQHLKILNVSNNNLSGNHHSQIK